MPPTALAPFATRILRITACLLGLVVAWTPALAGPAGGGNLPQRLSAARDLGGVDPAQARSAMVPLRAEAIAAARLDWRLAVDEAECRLLTDLDIDAALKVAKEGLQVAGTDPADAAREPWLRLRACRAGVLIESGDVAGGRAELERLVDEGQRAGAASALALARLERGLHRSRTGALLEGQQDLLAACAALEGPGQERDLELCLGHMANHYKRMGDLDEALRLLQRLYDADRARGALFDEGVHVYGLAQVLVVRRDWQRALEAFQRSVVISEQLKDDAGIAYAENGVAATLRHLGRPAEGLAHVERAMSLLQGSDDPRQRMRMELLRAQLLVALGRAAEALVPLQAQAEKLADLKDDALRAEWLEALAGTHGKLGHWREAYQALDDWRVLDAKVQEQRRSELAARQRMQFSRERDAVELASLRRLNEQGQDLRHMQGVALALGVLLLIALVGLVLHKIGQARRLQTLASTDELTGLPNRRALIAAAEDLHRQALREGSELSVLMIDVDHFKRINDSLGHAVGDRVLRHLAQLLTSSLRGHDRVGRLGGEEFLAVLPQASLAQAAAIAERMREQIAASPLIEPVAELAFTVSIGAAAWDDPNEDFAALLARADAALYRAKEGGRNVVALDEFRAARAKAEAA